MNWTRTRWPRTAALASLVLAALLFFTGCVSRTVEPSVTLLTGVDPSAKALADYLGSQRVPVITSATGEAQIAAGPECRAALIRYLSIVRLRMDTCAANIANVNTTRDAEGGPTPYRRRLVVLTAAGAAEAQLDESPFTERYQPGHPDANARGFVRYPNVDPEAEYLIARDAAQDYETAAAVLRRLDQSIVIVSSPAME